LTILPPTEEITHWSRVTRVVHCVEQIYEYRYSEPIRSLQHRFRVVPRPRHGDQRLLKHAVEIRGVAGEPAVSWSEDDFGNQVCTVLADRIPESITFDVSYQVERHPRALGRHEEAAESRLDLDTFLQPTPLTAADDALRDVADSIRLSSPWQPGRAYRAFHWAAAAIAYQTGVTDVKTPAATALAGGAGVCQDYSHILLAVLRLLDIPARYVSGHLIGEGAPHAWVEALFPDETMPNGARIVPYDPTNRAEPGLRYIAVAVGRDYADVAPTSGSFIGRARGELHYTKHARPIEVEYHERTASAVPTGLRPPHETTDHEPARPWLRGALA
jgi:transglutaminase-like putative cysteine protease